MFANEGDFAAVSAYGSWNATNGVGAVDAQPPNTTISKFVEPFDATSILGTTSDRPSNDSKRLSDTFGKTANVPSKDIFSDQPLSVVATCIKAENVIDSFRGADLTDDIFGVSSSSKAKESLPAVKVSDSANSSVKGNNPSNSKADSNSVTSTIKVGDPVASVSKVRDLSTTAAALDDDDIFADSNLVKKSM